MVPGNQYLFYPLLYEPVPVRTQFSATARNVFPQRAGVLVVLPAGDTTFPISLFISIVQYFIYSGMVQQNP